MTRPLRIGRMPYLNVAPFYHALDGIGSHEFVEESPARLGELARRNEVDLAPLSLRDTFDCPGMRPLATFAVACRGAVGSVLLFADQPLARLSGAAIRVTSETATSRRLLELLLKLDGVDGCRMDGQADGAAAELLIGEGALAAARAPHRPHVIDLCDEWTRRFNLPFVFARWMLREGTSDPDRVATVLGESLDAGMRDLDAVLAAGSYVLAGDQARRYLDNFMFRLDASGLRAIDLFRELLDRHGIH